MMNDNKPAPDYSSIREKLVYVSPTEEQYELLLKRTKEQLNEGRGETIIEVSFFETVSF